MKKAYKTPVVKVIEAEAEELICQSLGVGKTTLEMGGTVTADANSRYDDDEEDWGDMWQ